MAVVMGIMLMKIAPAVDAQVQRENEAELIFRGEAIANALRLYAAKMHRYPKNLDEVMKVRPRILRQKYTDPMTSDGEWVPITQVQPGVTGDTTGLPWVGVHSRSEKDSIHIYQAKTLVRDWRFTADQNILGVGGNPGPNGGGKGGVVPGGGIVPGGGDVKGQPSSGKS
jgi:type II secretory pathway pseudopilin PulG